MTQYWADACTKNCVWLFQIKEKNFSEEALDYFFRTVDPEDIAEKLKESDQSGSLLEFNENFDSYLDVANYIQNDSEGHDFITDELIESFITPIITYRTEAVFLFREEARNHGKRRPYAWGEEDVGWRIYGVPILGQAVELLTGAGVCQELVDKNIEELKWDNL